MKSDDIIELFDNWNSALVTGDPDKVTGLYATDAVLLPTLSNDVRHNHREIRDYFVSFLAKDPKGVINESNPRLLAEDLASNSGIYTFNFGDGSQATARFSYLYRKQNNQWQILEHHSSAMPEA